MSQGVKTHLPSDNKMIAVNKILHFLILFFIELERIEIFNQLSIFEYKKNFRNIMIKVRQNTKKSSSDTEGER